MQQPHAAALAMVVALSLAVPVGAASLAVAPHAPPVPAMSPGMRIRADLEHAAQILGVVPQALPVGPCPSFEGAVRAHFNMMGLKAPASIPSLHDPALEGSVACLLDAMRASTLATHAMLAAKGIDARAMLTAILAEDYDALDAMPTPDLSVALGAALTLADRADDAMAALKATPPVTTHAMMDVPEMDIPPVIAVDHSGPTLYDCDYALILDDNGDDLYDNNAGGTWLALGNMPIFFLSAIPDRCSQYIEPLGPGNPSVAIGGEIEFGFTLTASMLIDTQGSDSYGIKRAPTLDAICTREPVVRRIGAQGAGIIGPGLLIDTAGDNHLTAKTLSQGMGHSGGVGVLYLGPGDDTTDMVRSGQGSGVLGAIGLLVNEAGNDRYLSHVPGGDPTADPPLPGGTNNIDIGACDPSSRYLQGAGFGRITGVAASLIGILHDLDGNDYYQGDLKVQGAGEVAANGLLLDEKGNDVYIAQANAMGYGEGHAATALTGTGWFIDRAGDDRYLLGSAPGLGMGDGRVADPAGTPAPYIPPQAWAADLQTYFGAPLLLTGDGNFLDDGAGADTYSLGSRGNDMTVTGDSLVGVFIDR